ncbi:DUF3800 domain-containing protein, partial [Pseudomonas gingeri]|nr:DUF3800 domain-containing protein [Pseudomonas gingeri]NWE36957.1 DUF3800 domain-containing protein [Pseudomonas gingeri]NWE61154.1 DUF3800 domain-containing protein [Pseudomonas gingeri]NWF06044.1 DUF3800 domain-containing protein [Pseudomonas gingeri]
CDARTHTNLGKIFREDFQFVDSKNDFGIQLADLLSAGIRRCLRKEFKDNIRAAALLGRLMTQSLVDPCPLTFVSFGAGGALDSAVNELANMMSRQQRRVIMTIFQMRAGKKVILVIDGSKRAGALIERGFETLPWRVILGNKKGNIGLAPTKP